MIKKAFTRMVVGSVVFLTLCGLSGMTDKKPLFAEPQVEIVYPTLTPVQLPFSLDKQQEKEKAEEQNDVTIQVSSIPLHKEDTIGELHSLREIERNTVSLVEETYAPQPQMTSLGVHRVTGYTWTGNPCASGNYPYIGCCACNGLPFGSQVYVAGLGYFTVEDRGMMSDSYAIDVYRSSVDECMAITGNYEVFLCS